MNPLPFPKTNFSEILTRIVSRFFAFVNGLGQNFALNGQFSIANAA